VISETKLEKTTKLGKQIKNASFLDKATKQGLTAEYEQAAKVLADPTASPTQRSMAFANLEQIQHYLTEADKLGGKVKGAKLLGPQPAQLQQDR